MPLKEADKARNQILALLDVTNVDLWIKENPGGDLSALTSVSVPYYRADAVRQFAAYLRKQIGQGATDSTFAIS